MNGRQDSFRKMIVVLALICAAAGLALGATYRATRDEIKAQQKREAKAALRIVLPEAHRDGFHEVVAAKSSFATDGRYYKAYDAAYDERLGRTSGKLVGYVLEAAEKGYSSTIRVTIGVDPTGEVIRGIKITSQQETPGLGANCEEVKTEGTLWGVLFGRKKRPSSSQPWFQTQFAGKRSDSFVKVGNKYQNIDGLTGATITTNAVADAVVGAVREFRERVLKPSAASR